MDDDEEAEREDKYFIYHEPWFLRRSEFASFKLFLYAASWARSIFLGLNAEEEEEETEMVSHVSGVTCWIQRNKDNCKEVVLRTSGVIPLSFRSGRHIVLSRHSPDEDGLWKYSMRIQKIVGRDIVSLEPPRIPDDISEDVWRADVQAEPSAVSRLFWHLRFFTSKACESSKIRTLICDEPDMGKDVRKMNERSLTSDEEALSNSLCSSYTQQYRLNLPQERALRASLLKHVSLIQGPPGTGKTSVSVAILSLNKDMHGFVSASAQTNLAIDELGARLVSGEVEVVRYGNWRKIGEKHSSDILPRSVDYQVHCSVPDLVCVFLVSVPDLFL